MVPGEMCEGTFTASDHTYRYGFSSQFWHQSFSQRAFTKIVFASRLISAKRMSTEIERFKIDVESLACSAPARLAAQSMNNCDS